MHKEENYFKNNNIDKKTKQLQHILGISDSIQKSFDYSNIFPVNNPNWYLNRLSNSFTDLKLGYNYTLPNMIKGNYESYFNFPYKTNLCNFATSESIMKTFTNSLNLDKIVNYLPDSLLSINKIFEKYDFSSISKIDALDSEMLNKYYWVIPFEYDYSKLKNLLKFKTRVKFEKHMLKYFNTNRIKRMFSSTRKQCKRKDQKALMKQIENSFFSGNYAICITSLITILDNLTLQLLEPNSDRQHLSYKAITDMLTYINDSPMSKFSYELYLKVDILNNFYLKLYKNEENLKTTNKRLLSRHINSHGVKYSNNKIDVLRLLNAIYFGQLILDETKLQEQFTRTKKDKNFININTQNNHAI